MPKNLEIKIRLKSFDFVKSIIKKKKIKLVEKLKQKDIYYSVPDGLLKLRIENGNSSIIFYNRDEKSKNRWSDFDVIHFSDGDAEKFFARLFKVTAEVEKIRELYIYNNTRIHLDSVKKLGLFLELETMVVDGMRDAKQRFANTIELLNLNVENEIRSSYKNLITKK